eukprot:345182_1
MSSARKRSSRIITIIQLAIMFLFIVYVTFYIFIYIFKKTNTLINKIVIAGNGNTLPQKHQNVTDNNVIMDQELLQKDQNDNNHFDFRKDFNFNKLNKIFEISPGCSGTTSMFKLFQANGFKAYHNRIGGTTIFKCIKKNYLNNESDILYDFGSSAQYFGDMKPILFSNTVDIIKLLDEQYPGSVFILPTRPLSHWIKCVTDYEKGGTPLYELAGVARGKYTLQRFEMYMKAYCEVIHYLGDKLIIYDIEKEATKFLKEAFYRRTGIELKGDFPKTNHHSDAHQNNQKEQSGKIYLDSFCGMFQ